MDGKVILIVGRKKSGKTFDVKNLIKNVHSDALLLHDVSANYLDIYKKPVLDFDKFTEQCSKVSDCVCVYEEATIFCGHHKDTFIINLLVTARHRRNTSIFCFHSLQDIPKYIWRQSDILFLHKTLDENDFVQKKYRLYFEIWTGIMQHSDPYHKKVLDIRH